MKKLIFASALIAGTSAWADETEDAFVEANLLGIFYHELGHALIDVMQMPLFGQEEDAADVASILLIDQLYEPDSALDMAYHVSNGFWAEALANEEDPLPYWDVHGPDEQRFYNTVCIFYGGDPETRDVFAEDMELPEERAEYCEDEYIVAADSWGGIFDEMMEGGEPLAFTADEDGSLTAELIGGEVAALNEEFALPVSVEVITGYCDEANAFYDPGERQIIVCEEFETHLRELYRLLDQ